jgi:hypothetical protein
LRLLLSGYFVFLSLAAGYHSAYLQGLPIPQAGSSTMDGAMRQGWTPIVAATLWPCISEKMYATEY